MPPYFYALAGIYIYALAWRDIHQLKRTETAHFYETFALKSSAQQIEEFPYKLLCVLTLIGTESDNGIYQIGYIFFLHSYMLLGMVAIRTANRLLHP